MPIDMSKHKEAFLNEANANIYESNQALVLLEKDPSNKTCRHQVLRSIHSLKSLAATMNYESTTTLCHVMEDLLHAFEDNKLEIGDIIDSLFYSLDRLQANLEAIETDQEELDNRPLIKKLTQIIKLGKNGNRPTLELDQNASPSIDKIKSIEVKVEQLDALMNTVEELIVNQMHLDAIREQSVQPELTLAIQSLGRLISNLQSRIMKMRLVPIEFVFNRFTRTVRDLAKKQNKKIKLEMSGEDIEFDRLLIDTLGELMGHLIRNAVDHGIESPEERKAANKNQTGTIKLEAFRQKDNAVIKVSDDGRGLDLSMIRQMAIKRGLITQEANQEVVKDVIFSEFSTTENVSEFSGRGLGLSIVKEKMDSIGGEIEVESEANKGTTFCLQLPSTLAIIKILFVKIGGDDYAIPLDNIKRLLVINAADFKNLLEDKAIIYQDTEIPILFLANYFNKPFTLPAKQPIVIVSQDHQIVGLAVDSFHSIQDIIVKPLSHPIKIYQFFSGVAVNSIGQMVFILDIVNLLKKNIAIDTMSEGTKYATDS